MIGGVTVNVLLAFFIYAMILFTWGETKLPLSSMKDGVWVVDSIGNDLGFKTGDRIISVNGTEMKYYEQLNSEVLLGEKVTLVRDGETKSIDLPVNLIGKVVENGKKRPIFMPRVPAYVGEVTKGSQAEKAGLKAKDRIIGLGATEVKYYDQVRPILSARKDSDISVKVLRDGAETVLQAHTNADGTLGFYPALPGTDELEKMGLYQFENKQYGFFASFPAGMHKAIDKLTSYVKQFKKILNPSTEGYKGLGGFRSMGSVFPSYGWDWEVFWSITAFFSLMLAFMNLLPIPALDGGHVLFTLYEMVTRRKPSEKFLEYAQVVGMVLLLSLLLYANGNDWF
jgi:regulator of sigma E protease